MAKGKRSAKATAKLKPSRITGKQKAARRVNIEVARRHRKNAVHKNKPISKKNEKRIEMGKLGMRVKDQQSEAKKYAAKKSGKGGGAKESLAPPKAKRIESVPNSASGLTKARIKKYDKKYDQMSATKSGRKELKASIAHNTPWYAKKSGKKLSSSQKKQHLFESWASSERSARKEMNRLTRR